jgi:hypothetical protein
MSVDGDISYCSNEMDELGDKSMQSLKYKEANSSLHLVEKKEEAVHSRMFINQVSDSLLDDDSGSSHKGEYQKIANTNIRATNMDIIPEEVNEDSLSSSYRKANAKPENYQDDEEEEEEEEEEGSSYENGNDTPLDSASIYMDSKKKMEHSQFCSDHKRSRH